MKSIPRSWSARAWRWWMPALLVMGVLPVLLAGADWPAVAPADLAMKDLPQRPGAAAVILEKEVHCDNVLNSDSYFVRIKILTDAGRDFGNISIPYNQEDSRVGDIEARTIEPDGRIVPFTGKVFDSVLEKSQETRKHQKTFSMPEVQVGSIIDYRYRVYWHDNLLPASDWEVQSKLFIRHESFYMKPHPEYSIYWITQGLDKAHQPVRHEHPSLTVTLEDANVLPLDDEPYSLPRAMREQRVVFFYKLEQLPTADDFWKKFGKKQGKAAEKFIGKPEAVNDVLAQIVQPSDSPEVKLQKIYARLETVRNLSHDRMRPGGIPDLKELKDNDSAADLLKHNYGWGNEINETFVALARAAGFKAWFVLTSSRDDEFFSKALPVSDQMSGDLAEVEINGKDRFFDPGFGCPYGIIYWTQSSVPGMQLSKDGGKFMTVEPPLSTWARKVRSGAFKLMPDGSLQGELDVRFEGDEAFERTFSALAQDDTARTKDLTDEVRGWLPNTAQVKLEKVNGWNTWEPALEADFSVKIPGFATAAGSRLLFPQGIFETVSSPMFPAPTRKDMIYFDEPWQTVDDVTIALPDGYRVESTPKVSSSPAGSVIRYDSSAQAKQGTLHWRRQLVVDGFVFPVNNYAAIKGFFDFVRHNDQLQVVLQPGAPVAQLRQP